MNTWAWKIGGIIGSIALAFYCLVPTLFHFPETREQLETEEKQVPWYFNFFPQKGLNLGLDLRGGIYIELEVMVEEGITTKLDLLAQDLIRDLKRRNVNPVSWSQAKDHAHFEFVFSEAEALETTLGLVRKDYSEVLVRDTIPNKETPTVQFIISPEYIRQIRQDVVGQALQAVRNRIDRYGLTEPTVQRVGESRIVIELPGAKDPERALKIIKQAGKLEFKLVNNALSATELGNKIAKTREANNLPASYSVEDVSRLNELLSKEIPEGTEVSFELTRDPEKGKVTQATPYLLDKITYITGEMLKNAQVQIDPQSSQPYVSLTFNAVGAKNFADLTSENVGKYLAIVLDGNVSSAPVIKEAIRGGECRIDLGGFNRDQTLKEAKDLTLVLQEGALPARLEEATKTVIGPTLGADSIQKSLQAMWMGAVLVIFFMLIYYRLSGIMANFALLANALFIFAFLAMFQATLTLPGMAGIILTIGMSVDANILIFERIREELKAGLKAREAIQAGYGNAIRAIMDSNLTTIIAGVILYQFGTGPIRGFAVTLMIGLVCNLFTAVSMTRTIYEYLFATKKWERLSI